MRWWSSIVRFLLKSSEQMAVFSSLAGFAQLDLLAAGMVSSSLPQQKVAAPAWCSPLTGRGCSLVGKGLGHGWAENASAWCQEKTKHTFLIEFSNPLHYFYTVWASSMSSLNIPCTWKANKRKKKSKQNKMKQNKTKKLKNPPKITTTTITKPKATLLPSFSNIFEHWFLACTPKFGWRKCC